MYLLARNYLLLLSIPGGALVITIMHRDQLASAIFLTVYCCAVTVFWLLRGRATVDRYNAMLERRYRRIITETDYLYLFMEHEPAEVLRQDRWSYLQLLHTHNQPRPTFSDRVEMLAQNMDRLSRRLGPQSPGRIPWLNPITLLAVVLPMAALVVALLLGQDWSHSGAGHGWSPFPVFNVLAYCGAQWLLFRNISAAIQVDARWRVLVDELLGGRE